MQTVGGCGDCGDGEVAWVSYPNGFEELTISAAQPPALCLCLIPNPATAPHCFSHRQSPGAPAPRATGPPPLRQHCGPAPASKDRSYRPLLARHRQPLTVSLAPGLSHHQPPESATAEASTRMSASQDSLYPLAPIRMTVTPKRAIESSETHHSNVPQYYSCNVISTYLSCVNKTSTSIVPKQARWLCFKSVYAPQPDFAYTSQNISTRQEHVVPPRSGPAFSHALSTRRCQSPPTSYASLYPKILSTHMHDNHPGPTSWQGYPNLRYVHQTAYASGAANAGARYRTSLSCRQTNPLLVKRKMAAT
nr:hypothetical protein Iba_chr08cCG6900 [Ipomoea batatas]